MEPQVNWVYDISLAEIGIYSFRVHLRFLKYDSNGQPVALISNISLAPPSARSKNDTITTIYFSTFSQKYTITLIDTSMRFWSTFGCKFDINESAGKYVLLRPGTPVSILIWTMLAAIIFTMSSNGTITLKKGI